MKRKKDNNVQKRKADNKDSNIFSFKMLKDWRESFYRTGSPYRINHGRSQVKFVTTVATIGLLALFTIFNFTPKSKSPEITIQYIPYSRDLQFDHTYPITPPKTVGNEIQFKIGLISDMDTMSKVGNKNEWTSQLQEGYLYWNAKKNTVRLEWDRNPIILKSGYSLNGRGMELSELIVFDNRLLTFDDRTGIVYEIIDDKVVPWLILSDGNGKNVKGFKAEWATVKGELLYIGSMGKEWTTGDGAFVNYNPMWVKVVSRQGEVINLDWRVNYENLRQSVGVKFPGYMIHESGVWSPVHKRWFFLPRRFSLDTYNEVTDEHMGTNILMSADEKFTDFKVVPIGDVVKTRGYSSFKFIPSSNDEYIIALKTEEIDGSFSTYITVFTIHGDVILNDTKITDSFKYEGFEFI